MLVGIHFHLSGANFPPHFNPLIIMLALKEYTKTQGWKAGSETFVASSFIKEQYTAWQDSDSPNKDWHQSFLLNK